mmetsp:Transcript_91177/g.260392  ORF Transcript_91177/g.260392 Transcript_91177/m.260392 type:complete len:215 (-) Transcript_91177:58-702(-)
MIREPPWTVAAPSLMRRMSATRTRGYAADAHGRCNRHRCSTVFANACAHLSCEFVRALAEKVPPEHLAMPNAFDHTPMYYAAVDNSQRYAAPPCGPKTLTFAAAAGLTFSRMRTTTPTRGCWPGPRRSSRSTAPSSSSCSAVVSTRPAATTSLPRSEDTSQSCGATATRACECGIAGFLGVRFSAELGRLRRAVSVWRLGVGDTTSTWHRIYNL